MPVITVIDHNYPKLVAIQILRAIHLRTGVTIPDVVSNHRVWAVQLVREEDRDKLLEFSVRTSLHQCDRIEVVKPPDFRAKCTVMIADYFTEEYYDISERELVRQIEAATSVNILEMQYLNFSLVKVECNIPEDATRLLDSYIDIEPRPIHPRQMSLYRYTKVQQCTRCFSFDHEWCECRAPLSCFICGESGHSNQRCTSTDPPRCKNCHLEHVAIAFKCPVRKAKRDELEKRQLDAAAERLQVLDIAEGGASASAAVAATASHHSDTRRSNSSPHHRDSRQSNSPPAGASNSNISRGNNTQVEDYLTPEERIQINMDNINRIMRDFMTNANTEFGSIANNTDRPQRNAQTDLPTLPSPTSTATPSVQRPSRVLRPPNPQNGEGPRRVVRPIKGYGGDVDKVYPTPLVYLQFPALPKRQLRST